MTKATEMMMAIDKRNMRAQQLVAHIIQQNLKCA